MSDRKRNRKYILFLMFLGGFGFFLYRNLSTENVSKEVVTEDVLGESTVNISNPEEEEGCSTCGNTSEEILEEITPLIWEESLKLPLEKPLEVGSVLGFSSCEQYGDDINVKRLCPDEGYEEEYTEGSGRTSYGNDSGGEEEVKKNAIVSLTKVTYPAQLSNGSRYVTSNAKMPSYKDPVYLSAGDQLSLEYGQQFMTPEEAEGAKGWSSKNKEPFAVSAQNTIAKITDIGKDIVGKYIIEREVNEPYCSECEKQQVSAFNPFVSNKIGEWLNNILQIPGGDKNSVSGDECIKTNIDKDVITDGVVETCDDSDSKIAQLEGVIKGYFSKDQWIKCTEGEIVRVCETLGGVEVCYNEKQIDDCLVPKTIIIKMSSIFGATDTCVDGVCGNAGMTRRRKVSETPIDVTALEEGTSNYDTTLTHTVYTDCEVNVTTTTKLFIWNLPDQTYNVPAYCEWDMTPILNAYYAYQLETIPGDENFPNTFEKYWQLVLKAVERDAGAVAL
jgi:hypothetical protein